MVGLGPLLRHALGDHAGLRAGFGLALLHLHRASLGLVDHLRHVVGLGPLFRATLGDRAGVGNFFGDTLVGRAGHFLGLTGRNPDTLADGAGCTAVAAVATATAAATRVAGNFHHLGFPVAATNLHGLGGGLRHPLGHRAGHLDLFGVGNHHRVGAGLLFLDGNAHRVGLLNLFGVGNHHRVLDGLLFLNRHHHGVGAGLLFLDRNAHRVGLLDLFGVGNHHRVLSGLGFLDVLHDLVLDRLGASLGHADGDRAGLLFSLRNPLHDRVGLLTSLLRVLGAGHFPHLGHILPLVDGAGAARATLTTTVAC